MKKSRMFTGILAMIMILSMLSACAGSGNVASSSTASSGNSDESDEASSTEAKPIQVITAADELPIVEYAAKLYKETYGADVEIISQSYDQTYTKIITSVMSGAPVNVTSCDSIWAAEFGSRGILVPLNDYITDEIRNDVLPAFLDHMTWNGNLMGLPFTAQSKWLFYNKAMLEAGGYTEPPATWEELYAIGEDLKNQGLCKYSIAWAATQAEGLLCDWGVTLYASNGSWKDASGAWTLDSAESASGMNLIIDSIANGIADPGSISYTDRDVLNPFMAGDIPFVLNWNFAYALSNDETESKIAGDVGIALIPSNAEGVTSASVTGGGAFGITGSCEDKESAWKYIELIVSREVQEYGITEFSNLPILKSMYEDDQLMANYSHMKEMYPQLEFAIPRPSLINYSEWSNAMQISLHEAVTRAKSVEDALSAMQTEATLNYAE